MLTISYSGQSKPSALKIAEAGEDVFLVRDTTTRTDINWGRYKANSRLNPDISTATNKRVMRELFAEYGVPMPRLLTEYEARHFVLNSSTVVGRPDRHSKGRGLWKCVDFADITEAVRGTRKKQAATHFMEFVESEREYRVHVFLGKSIRISEKEFNDDGTYTTKKPGDIKLRTVREAAKSAVDALGLDFGTCDILAKGDSNEDVYVLEVNSAAGLGGSMPKLWYDTFTKWKSGDREES